MFQRMLVTVAVILGGWSVAYAQNDPAADLAKEIKNKGWLIYGARGTGGSWDLFVSRPDGSEKRTITNTPDYEEAAPRVAPDGNRMLYRRFAKGSIIDHDKWGFQGQLMVSNLDGTNAVEYGAEAEFPWACWSPDGKQLACLDKKGIKIVDFVTKKVLREVPRQGIYQQLFWSPDGKWFCGTGNHGGQSWTVVRVNAETGEKNVVRQYQNCTPDWCPDSTHIILSSRPKGQSGDKGYGYTQLWMCGGDGQEQKLLYGEDGGHMYGGQLSPDGQYVLFTKGPKDGSGSTGDGAPMGILRMADTPNITGDSNDLRALHPNTKNGPIVWLESAWEPYWTYTEIGK